MSDLTKADRDALAAAALEAWRALPDDERNGERPYIMGFNAGWEEALEQIAAWNTRLNSAPAASPVGEVEKLVDRFERAVIRYVQCARPEAQAAAGVVRDEERTALVKALSTPDGYARGLEDAAKVADETREQFGSPTGSAYDNGLWDQSVRIAAAIRKLKGSP